MHNQGRAQRSIRRKEQGSFGGLCMRRRPQEPMNGLPRVLRAGMRLDDWLGREGRCADPVFGEGRKIARGCDIWLRKRHRQEAMSCAKTLTRKLLGAGETPGPMRPAQNNMFVGDPNLVGFQQR
jgi:hypothetical protein